MCDKYKNNRMGFALNTSEYEKDSKIDYLNEGKLCLTEDMLKNWGVDEVVRIRITVNPTRLAAPDIMSMLYKTLKDIELDFKGISLMSIRTNYNREISIIPPTHVVIRARGKLEGLKTIGILDNLRYVNYLTVSRIIKESEINDYDPTDGCDMVDGSELMNWGMDNGEEEEDNGVVTRGNMSIPRFPSLERFKPSLDRQEDDDNDKDFGIGKVVEKLNEGKRCCRKGWNGKGMWIELQVPDENSKMTLPYVYMKTSDNNLVPWLVSQTDLLSNDWMVWGILDEISSLIERMDEEDSEDDKLYETEMTTWLKGLTYTTDKPVTHKPLRKVRFGDKGTSKKWVRFFPVRFCKDCPYAENFDYGDDSYWCRLYKKDCKGKGELYGRERCDIINKFGVYKIVGNVHPNKKV